MAAIFRKLTVPMRPPCSWHWNFTARCSYFLQCLRRCRRKKNIAPQLRTHIDRFIAKDRIRLRKVRNIHMKETIEEKAMQASHSDSQQHRGLFLRCPRWMKHWLTGRISSPVVDMENLPICNMMQWSNVTEQELAEKREIATDFGETLSWEYLCYVRQHRIIWNVPTCISVR